MKRTNIKFPNNSDCSIIYNIAEHFNSYFLFYEEMRRSAAPSQRSSMKKPCFRMPIAQLPSSTDSVRIVNNISVAENMNNKKLGCFNQTRSTSEVLKLLLKESTLEETEEETKESANIINNNMLKKPFKEKISMNSSKIKISSCLNDFDLKELNKDEQKLAENKNNDQDNNDIFPQHFNVMWCKLSKRKHKKWEGDGIIEVRERLIILIDLEGKEIARRSGYKSQEIKSLDEGQIIVIGNKECEIQSKLKKEDFTSGKCFQSEIKERQKNCIQTPLCSTKSFVLPCKNYTKSSIKSVKAIKSPYSVSSADQFVMPYPNNSHQWTYNKNQLPITDVIVDPKLANKLRPHQKEGVIFLYECILGFRDYGGHGAILADEMGLGKTLQCIALIWTLYKQGPYGGIPILKKILIITPSSLVKNWLKEFKKWLDLDKLPICIVDQAKKIQEFLHSQFFAVLLISYEMFMRNYDNLSNVNFDLVICDEGHRLKNTNIKTTNLLMGLQTSRRILLTGTPIQNDLKEFYSIVEFCNPGILGSPSQFHRIFEDPIMRSKEPNATADEKCLGRDRTQELFSLTSAFVLRRTQEVINKYLPKKLEQVIFCRPTVLQIELYTALLSSQFVKACFSSTDSGHHLLCITFLRKLCNHPLLLYSRTEEVEEINSNTDLLYQQILSRFPKNFETSQLSDNSGKLKVLSQLLDKMHTDNSKEKIVLVSHFTQTLDILQRFCKFKGYNFLRLDGSTPVSNRQNIVETFNSSHSNHFIFLLSSKAGGVGLNLIGASRILLYDIDWNPANDLQAMARVWRDGQKKQVFIYRLLTTGTIEEKIYQRQIKKQSICGAVVDCKDIGKVKFSLEELKDLFNFQENTVCLTHDLLHCQCFQKFNSFDDSQCNEDETEKNIYQLNETSTLFNKNVDMSELLKWKHIPGIKDSDTYQDVYLGSCKDDITFIFSNETNSISEF